MSFSKDSYLFDWQCHPKAEALVMHILDRSFLNPFILKIQEDLLKATSTRLFDWLDHVVVGYSEQVEKELENSGYVCYISTPGYRSFHHPGAQLPAVVLRNDFSSFGIAISVESIADFLMVRAMSAPIEGAIASGYRKCLVSNEMGIYCWVIERRGIKSFEPTYPEDDHLVNYQMAKEKWLTRPRDFENEDEGIEQTFALTEKLIDLLGQDRAAWVILECERKYWQMRNSAGQFQKMRQDKYGMGWANHDHHTFRSSRKRFHRLVQLFELIGFHCRERFYAGKEAGWGAQVMENPNCRLVLFLDTDLSPEEVKIDFAHEPLSELHKLGTIGLWCALHGDSILKAGMHHLEAQFLFDNLAHDLVHLGVNMMDPFSNFPYLRQAFTAGEIWHVNPKRIQKILNKGQITTEQADKFLHYGAIGSHLENLQRREGYKGFNKSNVSVIIKKTDPRGSAP